MSPILPRTTSRSPLHQCLIAALVCAAIPLTPAAALACGGLFCNNAQPVSQSAERIVFAYDDEQVHMHVQIAYEGPPSEFGWILPVPAGDHPDGVDTGVSSEELFTQLDALYGPRFTLNRVFADGCEPPMSANSDDQLEDGAGGGGAVVYSQEAVGPYLSTVLGGDSVEAIRTWLDENDYDIPEAVDAVLAPYIGEGRVFVALKLLPGKDSGDIQPLRITFLSDVASIPIIPTAVAAQPDMGVIVHVLDDRRAIPENYRHVEINEAAIDWLSGGQNYADVVSQAVDEADGHAFVTDYAGDTSALQGQVAEIGAATIATVAAAETAHALLRAFDFGGDADLVRVLDAVVNFPEGLNAASYLQCPQCFEGQIDDHAIDGAAVAAQIDAEINEARRKLARFLTRPYLTRLYTTLSADEMTVDPAFSFNADLPDVSNTRTADLHIECGDAVPEGERQTLQTTSGTRVRLVDGVNPWIIRRQAGATIQGDGVVAAALIEQQLVVGPSKTVTDRRAEIAEAGLAETGGGPIEGGGGDGGTSTGGGASSGGGRSGAASGCAVAIRTDSAQDRSATVWLLGFLALAGWRRRPR